MQSPWLANIDGSAHQLTNVGAIAIGAATPIPGVALTVVGTSGLRWDMPGWNNWGNAQLQIYGLTDGRKSLYVGFDTSGNNGVIQAGITAVSWNPLLLNPAGGNVGINAINPTAPLQVESSTTAENNPLARFKATGNNTAYINVDSANGGGLGFFKNGAWQGEISLFGGTLSLWTFGLPGNTTVAGVNLSQDGHVAINTNAGSPLFDGAGARLQVQGGLAIQGYDDANFANLRIINSPYGVMLKNDGVLFSIMATPAWQPSGNYSAPIPIAIDLGSKCVGIRVSPNTSYGLSVDSVNVGGSLGVGGNVWIGGDVELNGMLHMENRVIQGVSRYEGYSAGTGIPQLYCPVYPSAPNAMFSSMAPNSLVFVTDGANTFYVYVRDTGGQLRRGVVTLSPIAG